MNNTVGHLLMTRKRKQIHGGKPWIVSKKQSIAIAIILALVIAIGPVLYFRFLQPADIPFSMNAAIIDQLAKGFPNPTFVKNATTQLENLGFSVTYYNGSLDVNFFKGLAKYNCGIIILRVHSALREDNSTVDLFTSEEFDDTKYIAEQDQGLVTKGEFLYAPGHYYFAITSSFIENLEGRFPKSIILAMGCWSLKPGLEQTMAKAFIDKGATAYVGWTNLVLPRDTDNETLKLLTMLLSENKTLGNSVSQTREYSYRPYPYESGNETIQTRMNFYPPSVSSLKISNLIAEAKTTSSQKTFGSLESLLPKITLNAPLGSTKSAKKPSQLNQEPIYASLLQTHKSEKTRSETKTAMTN
jgi:hypothetical protein